MKTRKRRREELDTERQELMAKFERGDWYAFTTASDEIRGEFDVALIAVENYSYNLSCASEDLKNNYELVLAAVRRSGCTLQYASPALKASYDIVMAAVSQRRKALEFASAELQANVDVVLAAIHQNGLALEFAAPSIQASHAVVTEAVHTAGNALRFASPDLQANYDIVMTAVLQNGYALRYASSDLRANRNIVRAAVRKYGGALEFAGQDLKADKDLVVTAVSESNAWRDFFQFAAFSLQDDHVFVARAITESIAAGGNVLRNVLAFVSESIKRDLRDTVRDHGTLGRAQAFLHRGQQSHAGFMEFLCCVMSKSAAAARNPVTKVNLDKVTSEKLYRHIAEYVGVPLDQELEPMRLAKRVMPILEACFRGYNNITVNNDEQSLAGLESQM